MLDLPWKFQRDRNTQNSDSKIEQHFSDVQEKNLSVFGALSTHIQLEMDVMVCLIGGTRTKRGHGGKKNPTARFAFAKVTFVYGTHLTPL